MLDPFTVWKTFYETTESNLSDTIHETLQKESFAEWLGHFQGGYLQYQQLIQNTTDAYLKQINMPTRDEISNIASLIINLEDKVENLDEKIEDELLNHSTSSEVAKLKTSISKLEKKMDLILTALTKEAESSPKSTFTEKTNDKSS
nr:poly(R)-hydroxyalkanoic acid synthase subunit PhaE [Bacillus sp. B15-48]